MAELFYFPDPFFFEMSDVEFFMNEIKHMAEVAFDDQCVGANPSYPLVADLFRESYDRAQKKQKT